MLITALLLSACAPENPREQVRPDTGVTGTEVPVERLPAEGPGPYIPGVHTFGFTDPRGKDLVVDVWYPSTASPEDPLAEYTPTTLTGMAVRNALPQAGPFPVVAFSHGLGAIRYQSGFLTEQLASHGYVVVAPDHPRSTMFDLDEDAIVDVILERPDDVRFTVDELLRRAADEDDLLKGLAEDGSYVAVGHSFGAITVLALGGAAWDPGGVESWCAANGGGSLACRYVDGINEVQLEGYGGPDQRVIATVPMSPGLWYAFGSDGELLADVARPLVLAGDRDNVLPYDIESLPTYERLAGPKALATFAEAGHYPFSDLCRLAPFYEAECSDEEGGWMDIAFAQEATMRLVTAWVRTSFDAPGPGDAELLDPTSWGGEITLVVE